MKETVGKFPLKLIDTFKREYLNSRRLTEKQVLSSEIYASSFFDVSARSRFVTLVTAVEALLEPLERSDEVQALVAELKAMTLRSKRSKIDEPTRESIIGSLERLRHQSISQAGRTFADRLIPNDLFDGQSSADFFTRCYEWRSQIVHRGKIEDELVDMWHLANVMESFVARLLLAALNSVPQQGTGSDAKV